MMQIIVNNTRSNNHQHRQQQKLRIILMLVLLLMSTTVYGQKYQDHTNIIVDYIPSCHSIAIDSNIDQNSSNYQQQSQQIGIVLDMGKIHAQNKIGSAVYISANTDINITQTQQQQQSQQQYSNIHCKYSTSCYHSITHTNPSLTLTIHRQYITQPLLLICVCNTILPRLIPLKVNHTYQYNNNNNAYLDNDGILNTVFVVHPYNYNHMHNHNHNDTHANNTQYEQYDDNGQMYLNMMIRQGYPSIKAVVCGTNTSTSTSTHTYIYNSSNTYIGYCLQQLTYKLQHSAQYIKQSTPSFRLYSILSNIILNKQQHISMQYCSTCYWLVSYQCVLYNCSTQIKLIDNNNNNNNDNNKDDHHIHNNIAHNNIAHSNNNTNVLLYDGQFTTTTTPYTYYTFYYNSNISTAHIVYISKQPLSTIYYSCSSYNMTYIVQMYNTAILHIDIQNSNSNRIMQNQVQQCIIYSTYYNIQYDVSQLYYSSNTLHYIYPNKPYPLHITRSRPAILHYTIPSPIQQQQQQYNIDIDMDIDIHIDMCYSAPVQLSYYILPDFQLIHQRTLQQKIQDQQHDQDQDWIYRQQLRLTSNTIIHLNSNTNTNINGYNSKYMTNHLIIQLMPDTYSYIQLHIQQVNARQQTKQIENNRVLQQLSIIKQQYNYINSNSNNNDNNDKSAAFQIQFSNKYNQQIQLDSIYVRVCLQQHECHCLTLCKHITFIPSAHAHIQSNTNNQPHIQYSVYVIDNNMIQIIGNCSHCNYIAISASSTFPKQNNNTNTTNTNNITNYYYISAIHSKIHTNNYYQIIIIITAIVLLLCTMLTIMGVYRLVTTRPTYQPLLKQQKMNSHTI